MKKIRKILFSSLNIFVATFFVMSSCNKMDDIQKVYTDRGEQAYLGKVDSIKYYPGIKKAKLVWQINADPRIERTVIYWNRRQDSIVKQFSRTTPGIQKDSVTLENLPEGSSLVEFININNKGESSLAASATVTVWGAGFADRLRARNLIALDYSYEQSSYNLTLSPTTKGDSVVYSEIVYQTNNNINTSVRIDTSQTSITLNNFPTGGTFKFRTIFYPPQGIDTVYGEYIVYKAPQVIRNKGTKISLKANTPSKYFNYNGDLCEWNSAGDIIVYTVDANGEAFEKARYTSIVSRTAFKDFFFYDDDKFIGIQTNNNAYMYQFVNGILSIVKTPAGADILGSGFTFSKYAPAKGFFYSIADPSGEIKAWFALPNASWGTPNGTVSGTGFTYNVFTMFNYEALLGIDAAGYLWNMPVSVTGTLGAKTRIGSGWSRFKKLISIGTKLYGVEDNGDIYVFNDFNIAGNYWIVN